MRKKLPFQELILLPGILCDNVLWKYQVEELSKYVKIMVADLTPYDCIEDMAESVLANASPKFALAGLSMGGYVAQEIISKAPERVTHLALCNTQVCIKTPEELAYHRSLISQIQIGHFYGTTSQLFPLLLHSDHIRNKALTRIIANMTSRTEHAVFVRQQIASLHYKSNYVDLARISCPTLVLCGKQDAITPWQNHVKMALSISTAQLVIIERAGHLSPLEQPLAVNTAFLRLLQES